jgi:hypothetical protein
VQAEILAIDGADAVPHASLSTWSGVSSQANQMHDLPQITEPSLLPSRPCS